MTFRAMLIFPLASAANLPSEEENQGNATTAERLKDVHSGGFLYALIVLTPGGGENCHLPHCGVALAHAGNAQKGRLAVTLSDPLPPNSRCHQRDLLSSKKTPFAPKSLRLLEVCTRSCALHPFNTSEVYSHHKH